MRTAILTALVLSLALPCYARAPQPQRKAVKKSKPAATPAAKASSSKRKPVKYIMPTFSLTASAPKPQAVYVIPKAKVKYIPPKHEQEILGWILYSIRAR